MDEELGDEQWQLIAPLLPQHQRRGRPRADDRRTLEGILWVLRSGARWRPN
jgi:transposase